MFYDSVRDQLLNDVMKKCFALQRSQILYFFRDTGYTDVELNGLIDSLIFDEKILDADDFNPEIIRDKKSPQINSMELYRHIQAFWFIASLGSEKVRNIHTLTDCGEFIFSVYTGRDGQDFSQKIYDVSYIRSEEEAAMNEIWMNRTCKIAEDSEDYITHIAVVPSIEIGEQIRKFNYTFIVRLNENNRPEVIFTK